MLAEHQTDFFMSPFEDAKKIPYSPPRIAPPATSNNSTWRVKWALYFGKVKPEEIMRLMNDNMIWCGGKPLFTHAGEFTNEEELGGGLYHVEALSEEFGHRFVFGNNVKMPSAFMYRTTRTKRLCVMLTPKCVERIRNTPIITNIPKIRAGNCIILTPRDIICFVYMV